MMRAQPELSGRSLEGVRQGGLGAATESVWAVDEPVVDTAVEVDLRGESEVAPTIRLRSLDELPLLDHSKGLPAATPGQLRFKRALDVALSSVALILLSPVMALIALAVKLDSPGPAFYVSVRVGKDGTPIRIAKFRSMFLDADLRLPELAGVNEADGPIFKIKDDPRITRVGRLLRKLSLDELPQLFNVLRGEMTVVGPRPALPAEVDTYTERERQRLLVKPGLTCIWQVSGRSDLDFVTWMRMDLQYIQEWTPVQDVRLIAKTVPAVALGRGAY